MGPPEGARPRGRLNLRRHLAVVFGWNRREAGTDSPESLAVRFVQEAGVEAKLLALAREEKRRVGLSWPSLSAWRPPIPKHSGSAISASTRLSKAARAPADSGDAGTVTTRDGSAACSAGSGGR